MSAPEPAKKMSTLTYEEKEECIEKGQYDEVMVTGSDTYFVKNGEIIGHRSHFNSDHLTPRYRCDVFKSNSYLYMAISKV